MPVSGPYGRVLELCHGPQGDEEVLYFAVQTCEGLPRSNLSETQAKESRQELLTETRELSAAAQDFI